MDLEEIKNSGLLELYVIGDIGDSDRLMLEKAMETHPSLKDEVMEIEQALELYAFANAEPPPAAAGPMLMALADFSERIKNGEISSMPPALHPAAKVEDYSEWLDREDMVASDDFESMFGKVMGKDEERINLIIWLRHGAPDETHTDELESFLIVEGTCNITIGDEVKQLQPGDYCTIPLHVSHRVDVTSDIPCKLILERKAA